MEEVFFFDSISNPTMSLRLCRSLLILLPLLITPLTCCDAPKAEKPPVKTVQQLSDPAPPTRNADDAGRFLAGLPGKPGSEFAPLEQEATWKKHKKELDEDWNNFESSALVPMREFQKKELSGPPIDGSVIFYPFGGPDSLTLTVLFPQNSTYVMVGLEPPGTLPTPKMLQKKDLPSYLFEVRDTLSSELHKSFFITRQMDLMFRGQVTDGLLAPIVELLVRANHTILGYRYVQLGDDGAVTERPANQPVHGTKGNPGVEVDFRSDADQSLHKLYYFSINLSNDMLKNNPGFDKFLAKEERLATFLKSTSYLPHKDSFSLIRDQILNRSAAILQDDSGIPYRFFTPATWNVQLFGEYDHPYGSFHYMAEPDLQKAYSTLHPKTLSFRIGYGFSKRPSNLRLAKRISAH
jgi:hypothetical protein